MKQSASNHQASLIIPRGNQDNRIATAYNLLNANKRGSFLVHKTTRAGCTTALVAESLNRKEKFLVVVPTNKIADKTVIADSIKYSDNETCDIIHIPSNHACVKNQELCEEYPDLAKLPILPLAEKCTECDEYHTCPVTRILHAENEVDGVAITYQKLVALMLASNSRPNTTAETVLKTLAKMHNVVFDEIHEIQYGKATSLVLYNDSKKDKWLSTEKYIPVMVDFEHIRKTVANFSMLKDEEDVKNAILQTYNNTFDENYYRHKLSKTVENQYCEDFGDDEGKTKIIMSTYSEIIKLTIERKKYNMSIGDILELYKILNIVMSGRVVIHGVRDRGKAKIMMVAVDQMYNNMLKSYVMSIQNKAARTLLTSATICSHDYDQYFLGATGPRSVTFGQGGDPMSTNSKMLIVADTKKYHVTGKNSRYNKKEEILERITTLLDMYGDENCIIITLSIREANDLENDLKAFNHSHQVTYYKSPEMMGVSADARVMIAVGVADKPTNSFDAICETKKESLILREEALHCDTWQAWSRVKDPAGKVPSLVFAMGCNVEQCKNIVTWGYGRKVEIGEYSLRQKKKVNVIMKKHNITMPAVIKCKDFKTALLDAAKHKQPKNINFQLKNLVSDKVPNLLITYSIRRFDQKTDTRNLQCEIIKLLINRSDVYAEQGRDGSYFKVHGNISDKLLQNHVDGRITIGTYTLNNANEVKWICFDIDAHIKAGTSDEEILKVQQSADMDKDKMCTYLDSMDIPYMLEASGSAHSYHVWLFLDPVKANKAKMFGKMIMKEAGIKCELFPKQCTVKRTGYGNLVKMPFAINKKNGGQSRIFVDGEFVHEFDSYEVGIIDLSEYEVPEIKKDAVCSTVPAVTNGVRPIFEWALTQELEDLEGHDMRIAIVREYFNNGITNPDDLARLFSFQSDYDFEHSKEKVNSIICKIMPVWRWETVVEKCESLVQKFEQTKM